MKERTNLTWKFIFKRKQSEKSKGGASQTEMGFVDDDKTYKFYKNYAQAIGYSVRNNFSSIFYELQIVANFAICTCVVAKKFKNKTSVHKYKKKEKRKRGEKITTTKTDFYVKKNPRAGKNHGEKRRCNSRKCTTVWEKDYSSAVIRDREFDFFLSLSR